MPDASFSLPEELRKAFAGETKDRSFLKATATIIFPEVDDLECLPDDAEFVRLANKPKHLEQLRQMDRLAAIEAYQAPRAIVREFPYLSELRWLKLRGVKIEDGDFRALSECRSLEHLHFSSLKHLTDLSALAGLTSLKTLFLDDLPRLDYETLPEIPSLRELVLFGGIGATLKLPSLSPFAKLVGLRRLELGNVGATDGSLEPLAALRELDFLFLASNQFEVEEYARLKAALPRTRGRCLGPQFESGNGLRCPKCGAVQVCLNGKGTRASCQKCQAISIERHANRWANGLRTSW